MSPGLLVRCEITDQVAFPSSTLTRWQNGNLQFFELDMRIGDETFRYRLNIEHSPDGRQSRVTKETLNSGITNLFNCEMGEVQLFRDDGSEGPTYRSNWSESALARVVPQESNTRLTRFMEAVQSTVVCAIRPSMLGAESTREDPLLGRYAANFADWYRHAVQENPASARAHVDALQPVLSGFKRHPPSAGGAGSPCPDARLRQGQRWSFHRALQSGALAREILGSARNDNARFLPPQERRPHEVRTVALR